MHPVACSPPSGRLPHPGHALLPRPAAPVPSPRRVAARRLRRGSDARACAILLVVSALWLTDRWHGLDPVVPALFGAVLMVTPGIGVLSLDRG